LLTQGQNLVDEIQSTLIKAFQIRSLKSAKGENKMKKGTGMISKLFGVGGTSIKTENSLVNQQEEMKRDLELQAAEYMKLAQQSQPFRARYAYQMKDVIT
jgi:hypothetical protein